MAMPARSPSVATAEEVVRWYLEDPGLGECPQHVLDLAGVTRDGSDAAAERLRAGAERARVPPAFTGAEPDASVRGTLRSGRGMWLCGPCGVGKTHAACAMLLGWVAAGGRALFATEQGMLADVRAGFDSGGGDRLLRYCRASMLVLDDVGKERATGWVASQLFRLLDERGSHGLPTVVTSQLAPEAWLASVAEASEPTARALESRLLGGFDVRRMAGPDRRAAGRKQNGNT